MISRTIGDTTYLVSYDDEEERTPSEVFNPSPARVAELAAMPYKAYLSTPEWRETRRIAIGMAEHRCERCYRRPARLEVHHLTYERRGREWPEDLQVLCGPCHRAEHRIAA